MVIKINYTSSDVYVSTNVSPVYVVVNYSGTSTGGGVWGQITGTLSNQTDLQNALDAKFDDPTGTTAQYLRGDGSLATFPSIPSGTVTSVGLTMPSAFSVANSPVTSSGTLAVTGAGTASQYVRGDGQLANFPDNGGGGSSVNYYLNGSVTQGTFGGVTYYEMSKTPVLGAGTDFTRTNGQGNGYIASFITDAGDPSLLNIPGGNWNLEFYFQSSASGGSPQFYGEVYKVDASNNFTLVASGSTNPEGITNGTTVDQYFTSIPVPQTSLLVTDRLAIRIYVITSGRTITLHTEDGNLCEVLTTFSTGLNALNGLTAQVQYFATGTSGTDFAISSATDTHTFNLPTASATNRGALSSADWSTFNAKVGGSGVTGQVAYWNGTNSQTGSNNLFWDTVTQGGTLLARGAQGGFRIGNYSAASGVGAIWNQSVAANNTNYILASSANEVSIQGPTSLYFQIGTSATTYARIFSTGNFALQNGGTFTDGGQRLQVNGSTYLNGNIDFVSGNFLRQSGNTAGGLRFVSGDVVFYNTSNNAIATFTTGTTGSTTTLVGLTFTGFLSGTRTFNNTSGTSNFFALTNTFNPTSGTGLLNVLTLDPTINQTGGANGITRGLYVNPTLTAAADWRSIEWSNNSGWGLYGAGTANNYLGGNLGVGVTPSAWTNCKAIDISTIGSVFADGFSQNNQAGFATNAYRAGAAVWFYKGTAAATYYAQDLGTHKWYNAPSGTAGNAITFTQAMTLTAAGRLLLGLTAESTFLLDVNGTARVSGSLTVDTNTLFVDATNDRVGIGTTSPATALHVLNSSQGVARFQSTQGEVNIALNNSSASGNLIGTIGAAFYLYSGGAERFRLDASGNLGLGVVPSAWSITPALQVVRASIYNQGDDGTYITSNGYFNAGWKYIGAFTATQYIMLSGQHRWLTAPSGTAGNAISFTQAMTLTSGGNLLVGTTTDGGYRVDINGTLRVTNQSLFEVTDAGVGTKTIVATFGRTGASSTGTSREAGIVFRDSAGTTLTSGITGVRENSAGNWLGGLKFYVASNPSLPSSTFANLTEALSINSSGAATFSSSVTATQFRLSALNTAPANASATGTLGEIRIDADYIYVCTATNTWKRTAIATW